DALALPRFLVAQLGAEIRAEVLGLEHAPDLDLLVALLEGRAADPLDRFLHRLHLPEPEARDQLLGLRERPGDYGAPPAAELDAPPLSARVQSFAGEHHPRLDQFLVELAHLGENFPTWQDARFGLLVRFYNHHDSHEGLLHRFYGSTTSGGARNRHGRGD